MSIPLPGDWPLTGAEEGADLWPLWNRLAAGTFTNFANGERAPDIADGGLWSREEADGTHSLMLFSAGNDVPLLRSTPSGALTSQFIYTKTEVDNLMTQLAAEMAELGEVPVGGVIMWSGSIGSIPDRYALCNGSSGTPNLRDRFIVAAGGAYSVGDTGGQDAITQVPRHNHSFSGRTNNGGNHNHGGQTGAAGAHAHTYTAYERSGSEDRLDTENDNFSPRTRSTSSVGNHRHSIPSSGSHDHSFSGTTNNTGSSSVDVRPRYYALAYIMRIS